MRLSMVAQWMRAARGDPSHRVTALRYARGIALVQVVWVALLFVPVRFFVPGFVLLGILELLIPAWAERAGMTPWHPHHITERYGLMTIIVLGESVLAATMAAQQAIASDRAMADLAPLIVGGLLIVFAMWWLYFDHSAATRLSNLKRALTWGYGHYLVFAAAAAVGAGLAVALDHDIDKAHISDFAAGAAVAIPVALYLSVLWLLHARTGPPAVPYMTPVMVALVLLAPLTNHAVPLIGLLMAALLTAKLLVRARSISSGTAWWRGS
jgi:low temperature requirement protein LtrA